jgi:hypothetical protein
LIARSAKPLPGGVPVVGELWVALEPVAEVISIGRKTKVAKDDEQVASARLGKRTLFFIGILWVYNDFK